MGLVIHSASHLDHGLSQEHIAWILKRFADRDAFFIETVTLPRGLPSLPCALHGPAMGDRPIPESEVVYKVRGNRRFRSRLVKRPTRPTRKVTVIAGPHDGSPCVLFTAYGGPKAPREPYSLGLNAREARESEAFWSQHALSENA